MKITRYHLLIKTAKTQGVRKRTPCVSLFAIPGPELLIFAMAKKVDKRAVVRNKTRRWFKEARRHSPIAGTVVVKVTHVPQSYQDVQQCWRSFKKLVNKP